MNVLATTNVAWVTPTTIPSFRMPPTNPQDSAHWESASRLAALPEFWTLVAQHTGLVGAHRLKLVCKAAKLGALEYLKTLKQLVVCGGDFESGDSTEEVWRLDLGTLRWEQMHSLNYARSGHACCVVRGNVVVIGGQMPLFLSEEGVVDFAHTVLSTVEVLREVNPSTSERACGYPSWGVGSNLSCGPRAGSSALPIHEHVTVEGQVLLIGGFSSEDYVPLNDVVQVDLATGACSMQAPLLRPRHSFATSRLPDGRIVCAGGCGGLSAVEIFEPPTEDSPDIAWCWRSLPDMSIPRRDLAGCVMSDGRFAVFGGENFWFPYDINILSSCEVLCLDGEEERWEPLPSMLTPKSCCMCVAVGGCVIVTDGDYPDNSMEVYEEALGVWRKIPSSHSQR